MTPISESTNMNEEDISTCDTEDENVDDIQSNSGSNERKVCTPGNDSVMNADGIPEDHSKSSNITDSRSDEDDIAVGEDDTACASTIHTDAEKSSILDQTSDEGENNRRPAPNSITTDCEMKPDSEVSEDSNSGSCTSKSVARTSPTASETSDYFSIASHVSPPVNEDSMQSTSSTNEDANLLADLPREMVEEEQKFAKQTESDLRENCVAPLSGGEREKRYKTLMSLLGKSKEYASYMSHKLTSNKDLLKETAANESPMLLNATDGSSTSRKRKNGDSVGSSPPKKAKSDLSQQRTYDPRTHYVNDMNLIVSCRQPRLLTGGVMRDYQLDGLEWMIALYTNGVNGILADEMGLGKTIQTISLLCHLREKRVYGPHLVIGPLSTLPNWLNEFANFAPELPVILFHGTEEKRNKIIEDYVAIVASKDRPRVPVVLTSYEMPIRDKKFLSAIKWRSIIVDEGHRLKNYQSMLAKELRRYKTDYRLLLTGTPLQNNLSELWSLLNYLIPEIFDNLEMFQNLFDFSDLRSEEKQKELIQREQEEQLVSKMHQILEPFLLRRVKADVDIALPGKKEIIVKAPMTAEQQQLYKCVIDRSIDQLISEETEKDNEEPSSGKRTRSCAKNKNYSEDWEVTDDTEDLVYSLTKLPTYRGRGKRTASAKGDIEYVFNVKLCHPDMMLRKIANHPYLVKTPVEAGTRNIIVDEDLIQQSGKLLVLDALLPRLKAGGHKILLFSAFVILLDLIEDYVIMRGYKYVRFDGSTNIENRLKYIKQFNSDADTFIFLITTRSGGLGVNLTGADTVIIYDSDWNPQVDLQAQDRCHRIGQTRPVVVYRLLTAGTIDEYIMNTAVNKRRLEKLVVKKGKFKQQRCETGFNLAELKELMESTDYKQVMHPNGLVLSDGEIERLLDRSDLVNPNAAPTIPAPSKVNEETAKKTPRRRRTKNSS